MKNLSTHASGQIKPATVPVTLNSKNRKAFSRRPKTILVILLSVSLLLLSQFSNAQAPQQFSFQGVAKDAVGKVVSNATITVRIKIHKDNPNGTVVFSETQIIQTNSSGIFTLIIGGLTGGLDVVNWGSDNCFIQVEIDVTGGSTFVDLGTTQIKSVPYALASRQWVNNIPIVQTGVFGSGPSLPSLTAGANLIWYPKKAAFRVGQTSSPDIWGDASIGINSFATGFNSVASGEHSIAMGNISSTSKLGGIAIGTASSTSGNYGVAIGHQAVASGINSVSIGYLTTATGESSVALGGGTVAKSLGAVSLGAFNNSADPGIFTEPTDRIFQIGNGSTANNRSNALTILRNGNVGIGNNVLIPEYVMDFGGRPRIRHSGSTAGLFFNNSQNAPEGFVGMKTDKQIGLFINGKWEFWVDDAGNAHCRWGQLATVSSSDIRLKKDLKPIKNSLQTLHRLSGYTYHWINPTKDKGRLQNGLIAQELEKVFPELVYDNSDGYKAVNYIGLIPHLIEAVKELDKKTEEIAGLKKELAEMKEINKRVMALEAGLKSLLTENKSAIGKSQAK